MFVILGLVLPGFVGAIFAIYSLLGSDEIW